MKKRLSLLVLASSTSTYLNAAPIEPVLVALSNKEKNIELQMGKYEVTVAEFAEFVKDTGFMPAEKCRLYNAHSTPYEPSSTWDDKDLISNPYRPAVCIGFEGADAYTKWLAKKTNKPYRLPTFDEWKYAASAGKNSRFAFGEDLEQTEICQYENIEDYANAAGLKQHHNERHEYTAKCNDGAIYHTVVGMYRPNQFGLYDMMGNVREYLTDCVEYDAENPNFCNMPAIAGSSWHWVARPVEVLGSMPHDFYGSIEGFRIVLDSNKIEPLSQTTKQFQQDLLKAQINQRKLHQKLKMLPTAPQHLIAKKQSNNKVKLSWISENKKGVTYSIYRSYLDNSGEVSRKFSKIAEGVAKQEFIDTLPGSGVATYQVFANSDLGESMASNNASVGHHPRFTLADKIEAEQYNQQQYAYIRSKELEHSVYFDSNHGHYTQERSPLLPAWIRFNFDSNYTGTANLTMRLKGAKGAQVELWQGHHLVGVVEINGNKEFAEYKMPVTVVSSNEPLEVRSANKMHFQLDWFELNRS